MSDINHIQYIDQSKLKIIADFAAEYYDGKERQQSEAKNDGHGRSRRIEQVMMGKMAEEAVCQALGTTAPDYAHYARGTRMTDADLDLDGLRIHVKACSMTRCDWVADPASDRIVTNPLHNDVIVMCRVDPDTAVVELVGIAAASDLVGKWQEPSTDWMAKKGKKALYWSAIALAKNVNHFKPE